MIPTRTTPPSVRMPQFTNILSFTSVCEANIITQLIVCHVMLKFATDILCLELFLQVMNNNKNCLLLDCSCQNCGILAVHDHQAIACHSDCLEWGGTAWPRFVSITAQCSAHYSTARRPNGHFLDYSPSHNWPFKLGNRIPDTSYGKNAQCSSPLSLLFKAFRKPLTFTPTLKQAHTSTQS